MEKINQHFYINKLCLEKINSLSILKQIPASRIVEEATENYFEDFFSKKVRDKKEVVENDLARN